MQISTLFGSIRRWLKGRLGGHRRGHAYFHDFEPGERRYDEGPSCPPNLRGPAYLLVFEQDVDFQSDSLAFDVLEFREGLLGDIDGVLEGMKKIHQRKRFARRAGGRRSGARWEGERTS